MPSDSPIQLLQLTDSHLYADPSASLLGIATAESLRAVVELARREQPRIDLLLATGDLSQDGSSASYRAFLQACAPLAAPACWIPGNHDDAAAMVEVGAAAGCLREVVELGAWRVLLLDCQVPGAVFGHLGAPRLEWLAARLDEAPQQHHLICLHHQPAPVGSRWMDGIGLRDGEALLALLAERPQARVLLHGHVHQAVDQQVGSLRVLATPSTCVQFTPRSEDFAIEARGPGYRWLRLHADGRVDSEVSRLADDAFVPDPDATGY